MQENYYGWDNRVTQDNQSQNYNQPSYTYRDQFLFPAHDLFSTIKTRQARFRILRLSIQFCFILLPFVGAWLLPTHFESVYSTYQQGTCTITFKDVDVVKHTDKYGNVTSVSYYPHLFYTVNTPNGNVENNGYDGPTAHEYSSFSDAQVVIDKYQIGEQTQCYYNPAAPAKAFIIFYGYTENDRTANIIFSFVGFAAFSVAIYLIFDWIIWRLFALWRRGVVTQGTVLRQEERRNKSRRYIVSIIGFQALEEPQRWHEITVREVLPVRSLTPVCYDPLFPRYRRHGEWPLSLDSLPGILSIAAIVMIGLIILLVVWELP